MTEATTPTSSAKVEARPAVSRLLARYFVLHLETELQKPDEIVFDDLWGATVNFARRMESSGAPGRIHVFASVYGGLGRHDLWEARGPQPVKNLGRAEMYFLLGKKTRREP
jgi:class 3 adenylate cyclase